MKRMLFFLAVLFLAMVGWRIGSRLSADAVGMAVGVMFGVMAGLPTALLVLASGRRRYDEEAPRPRRRERGQGDGYPYPQQPPVIVLANAVPNQLPQAQGYGNGGYANGYSMAGQGGMQGQPPRTIEAREFRVVGEREEIIDEW